MLPGVKFIPNISYERLAKWEKAIVIYQTRFNKKKDCHFGLLIKYKTRLITLDGV